MEIYADIFSMTQPDENASGWWHHKLLTAIICVKTSLLSAGERVTLNMNFLLLSA